MISLPWTNRWCSNRTTWRTNPLCLHCIRLSSLHQHLLAMVYECFSCSTILSISWSSKNWLSSSVWTWNSPWWCKVRYPSIKQFKWDLATRHLGARCKMRQLLSKQSCIYKHFWSKPRRNQTYKSNRIRYLWKRTVSIWPSMKSTKKRCTRTGRKESEVDSVERVQI